MKEDKIVILASGRFPAAGYCLDILEQAGKIICCDEAADHLLAYGKDPDLIIGDLDSISRKTREQYQDRMIRLDEQETNDLTKAVNHCIERGFKSVTILGATGLREDHTLGNISLLLEYNQRIDARMVTDYGEFRTLKSGERVNSYPGEQVSLFSVDNHVRVRSEGLKYPLENMRLHNWWRASLNEVEGDYFAVHFSSSWPLLLYRLRKK